MGGRTVKDVMPEKGHQAFLLLGPTGSGKTPLGDMIAQQGINSIRCLHFDFGSELRSVAAEQYTVGSFTSAEVDFVKGVVQEGLLLENEHFSLARKIFKCFIERNGAGSGDLILLNGLPRHRGQAGNMRDMVDVETVVVLECSAADLNSRIKENTGGDRTGRDDDELGLIQKKVETYRTRTAPLIDYYREREAAVLIIPVTVSMDSRSIYELFLSRHRGFPGKTV
jgi:adenylate kinase family enzyme